ncbi:hypothetical protein ACH5RR_040661 [Cinchona calisaya]|uniref:Disease resistance protein RPM1-like n=1 Tax=Cinchona calisaya TaxID=153742 RepID=A0ABD2XXG9_9GENT
MAESAVSFLLQQISTFLLTQSTRLGGLEQKIQFLKDELGSMRAFLRYAELKQDDVSELKEWVGQVREVAYDTQDLLDEFIMRFARDRPDGFSGCIHNFYCSIKNIRARHRISSTIENMKCRVKDISKRHKRYRSDYGLSEKGSSFADVEDVVSHFRGNALLLEEAELVGIENPKRELISQILDGSSNLKVVSVVGMGGMGKTTLVKRVYEDANVKRRFQLHAWLTISQTFHMKEVLKDLIQQFFKEIKEQVPQEVESMYGDKLRAFIKDFLQEKKYSYIIVLDDLWKLESWEAIKYAFPETNCGSRIMLTTRISDTASRCCTKSNDYVHKMQFLSDEESWTLFCSKTFPDNCCPPHLEDVSRVILHKCKGLPLAIVSISGVLASKDKSKVDEWEMILHGLGGELEGIGKLERVKKILLLSYNDLPWFLKSCLLYMSIYPEDWKINVEILIRKWIAEGFILEREGMMIVEVARGYLNELINRSLIQVAELNHDGSITYCNIHDILREIILTKSREQNLVTVATNGDYSRLPDNIRRLGIHGFIGNHHQYNRFKHIRSLVIFENKNPLIDSLLSKLLIGGSKLLSVLDLEGEELKSIPKEVFKLFHLKYLSLAHTKVEIIPQSIGKLQNLEFLNLFGTHVIELPIGILNLRKLRELLVFHEGDYSKNFAVRGFKAPREIGRLLSLEVLNSIDAAHDETVREIGKLTQLRELSITKLRRDYGKELCSSLGKLTNLRKLFAASIKDEILDLQHPISPIPRNPQGLNLTGLLEKVPQWLSSLQGLTKINLCGSRLREDPLKSLQDLPNLVEILLNEAYEGEELSFKVGGFQKLKQLDLMRLQQLKWVRLEADALPCLQMLSMTDCKQVNELPCGIQNLKKLQSLEFNDMGNELVMKLLDKRSDEYQKVVKVPKIAIANWIDGEWDEHILSKPAESNATTSSQKVKDWDVQVSFAVEECAFCCITNQKHELALTTVNTNPINYNVDWIIDSGCSNHIAGDKRKLTNLTEYKEGRVVVTADNSRVYQNKKITGTPIMQGKWMETVYVMSAQEAYVDKARKNETADLWHARLGHASYHKLKIMMMKSMLKGLPQLDAQGDIVCAGCQ